MRSLRCHRRSDFSGFNKPVKQVTVPIFKTSGCFTPRSSNGCVSRRCPSSSRSQEPRSRALRKRAHAVSRCTYVICTHTLPSDSCTWRPSSPDPPLLISPLPYHTVAINFICRDNILRAAVTREASVEPLLIGVNAMDSTIMEVRIKLPPVLFPNQKYLRIR